MSCDILVDLYRPPHLFGQNRIFQNVFKTYRGSAFDSKGWPYFSLSCYMKKMSPRTVLRCCCLYFVCCCWCCFLFILSRDRWTCPIAYTIVLFCIWTTNSWAAGRISSVATILIFIQMTNKYKLSLVTRKPVFGVCDQVRLKLAFSSSKTS